MKKTFPLLALCLALAFGAKSQCSVDTNNTWLGLLPPDTLLSPIVVGSPYDTTVQEYSPDSIVYLGTTSYIYWAYVDTILGFPKGIRYSKYPNTDTIPAGGRQCLRIFGTTTDAPGLYPLVFVGNIHVSSQFLGGDTVLTLQELDSDLIQYGVSPIFSYNLYVNAAPPVQTCVIDGSHLINPGVYPVPTELPCIVQTTPYDQTVQGQIQTNGPSILGFVNVNVDSVQIDSISGLPSNITWAVNPKVLQGGGSGCINFAGTTSDPIGQYPLTAWGTAWLSGSFLGQKFPLTRKGNLNQYAPFKGYFLRVVTTADSCTFTVDIHDYVNSLNAEVSVFPNPNNGVFGLKINAASPVTGQVVVFDAIGSKIYEQPVDVLGMYTTTINLQKFSSGLYTLQVRTAQGNVSRKILVE